MIDLNFLPQNELKVSKQKYVWVLLKHIVIWFNFAILIVGMLLLWSKFFLERNLANWQEQSILVAQNRLHLTDQVGNLNKDIRDVNTVQGDYVVWSSVITTFSELVPRGARIDELVIDTNGNTFVLRGFSNSRSELLQFEENLKASELVLTLNAPLSNLLSPKDIEFDFSGTLAIE